ncbi:S-layer homology domain-containing protein [Salibacterium halotolerans]|uniref:S-layer homology domain-containing protein n=1 Tax=Salibacterium halotolerans TaxID=1884432 RepID=A0A1I5WS06_9BACI|nr:S-layer homology domain-containing protein [Salibacterium halotolerans]SFQ22543.1 S-layer homology domain-containing protein [Salibacterium halotolerans]
MKGKRILTVSLAASMLVPSAAMAADNSESKDNMEPTVSTSAADLRADLSRLLASHFEYQVLTAVKVYQQADDAEMVREKLEENAQQITTAMESIYGEEGASQFADIFSFQYEDSSELGMALRNGNMDEREEVKDQLLNDFPSELGGFLGTATGGNLPADKAEKALRAHEQDVINVAKHFVNGDYEEAYAAYDEGYKHMYTIGGALSSGIVTQMPEMFNHTEAMTPAADLRASFNQLLGLHFDYQVLTAVQESQNADGTEAAREQLEANAGEMVTAVESIYGEEGAAQFEEIFSSQYEDTSGLGNAIENNDDMQKEEVKDSLLMDFPQELGMFLETATEGNLSADTAESVLNAHEQDVIDVVESYVMEDYEMAYNSFDEGGKRMSTIGTALSGAIVTQMPDMFAQEEENDGSEEPEKPQDPMNPSAVDMYSDINADFWAVNEISHLTNENIIKGYMDGTFRPNEPIKRVQAAKIITGALDLSTENRPDAGFDDISSDYYGKAYIDTVADEGIMMGHGDEFNPNDTLTRAQMAVVLERAFGFEAQGSDASFTDISSDYWAHDGIHAVVSAGLASGYPDDTFRPGNETTRAQFSVFISNTLDWMENQ